MKTMAFFKRVNFITLCIWLIASAFMAVAAYLWFGQDFRGYYAAARITLDGKNPYDYSVLAPELLAITGRMGNNPYYYAPWFAWFIIPFSLLPFDMARAVWMIFNLILWNFSLWKLGSLFDWAKVEWKRWLVYFFSTIVFAWITWRYEQTGILLFALLVGVIFTLRGEKRIMAGVLLSMLLIKPNVTLIPTAAIVIWLIRRRNWQTPLSMCIVTFLLLAIAFIWTPNFFQPFLDPNFGQGLFNTLDGPGRIESVRINTTLNDWLAMYQIPVVVSRMISALAFLIGMAIIASLSWKSESLIQVIGWSLLVNFAVTPYALQYDYPPLTLVLFWSLAIVQYQQRRWIAMATAAAYIFIISVLFWERPISDGYWIVLGLIVMTILNWFNVDRSKIPLIL